MTTTSVTCEIRLAEAIQYLAYTGGDTEVILHLRLSLGVIFILAERQRMKESALRRRRRKGKNLETRECVLLFFLCVLVSIDVEGRVLVLSVSREVFICFLTSVCFCVLGSCFICRTICRTSEDKGIRGCMFGSIEGNAGDM